MTTMSTTWRRLVPAALLAAAATLGGSAVVDPATACAAPNTGGSEGVYNECVARGQNERFCCSQAGGQWTEVTHYGKDGLRTHTTYQCTGLTQPQTQQPTMPGVAPRPGEATQPPPPPPPPVRNPEVIPTFQPAPVGPVG